MAFCPPVSGCAECSTTSTVAPAWRRKARGEQVLRLLRGQRVRRVVVGEAAAKARPRWPISAATATSQADQRRRGGGRRTSPPARPAWPRGSARPRPGLLFTGDEYISEFTPREYLGAGSAVMRGGWCDDTAAAGASSGHQPGDHRGRPRRVLRARLHRDHHPVRGPSRAGGSGAHLPLLHGQGHALRVDPPPPS